MAREKDLEARLSRLDMYSSGDTEAAKTLREVVLELAAAMDRLDDRIGTLEREHELRKRADGGK